MVMQLFSLHVAGNIIDERKYYPSYTRYLVA